MPETGVISRAEGAPKYSFVIPVFNEAEVVPLLTRRLAALLETLDGPAEVILVDDGSRDATYDSLVAAHSADPRFKVISLSRNFGHQLALTAGLDAAAGDAVVTMDCDLQDPPEVVPDMIAQWKRGFDVVYGVRREREGESLLKRATAHLFYRLLRFLSTVPIPLDTGDFRLVDRTVVEAFRQMREHNRFLRGMFTWAGFRQTGVPYVRHSRAAGRTKYSLIRMLNLALHGMIAFSDVPLRLCIWVGALVSAASLVGGCALTVLWATGRSTTGSWAPAALFVALLAGLNMIFTGVVGLYVGRIHEESQQRPLYVISARHGFENESTEPPRNR